MERKEAIEVVKNNWPDSSFKKLREALETLIPELKESEDEIIRKNIIRFFKELDRQGYSTDLNERGYSTEEWIAWLEKQREQKSSWSEEDEIGYNDTLFAIEKARLVVKDESDMGNLWFAEKWLKSLKSRVVKIEK